MVGTSYYLNELYSFEIIKFSYFLNRQNEKINSVVVIDKLGNQIEVRATDWQIKELWNYKELICKVSGFTKNGGLKLENVDHRHPYLVVGESYEFEIIYSYDVYDTKNIKEIKFFKLKDIKGRLHDIIALPIQYKMLKEGDKINCKVERVHRQKLQLNYINKDPFFSDFNEIVGDVDFYKRYFLKKIESKDGDCIMMSKQYNDKSGFYIFTFCSKILPKELKDLINRKDYKSAIEINELIITIENWILNKGILQSFPDEKTRKLAKERVKLQIKNSLLHRKVLPILNNKSYSDFFKLNDIRVQELYYLISFSDLKLISPIDVIKTLNYIDYDLNEDSQYFNKLSNVIRYKKKEFIDYNLDDHFNFYTSISSEDKKNLEEYLSWTYCQILIFELLGESVESNLLKSQFLRYNFYSNISFNDKFKLLKNSFFYIRNFTKTQDKLPILISEKSLVLEIDKLKNNPNLTDNLDEIWSEIVKTKDTKEDYIEISIKEVHYLGFNVEYKGVLGYLPKHLIFDSKLRNYNYDHVNWVTRVKCLNFSKELNYFTCSQLTLDDKNFYSEKILDVKPAVGHIVKGKVKAISDYGLFVTTIYGDGLLHINNLTDNYWDYSLLCKIFKQNQEIFLVIKNINAEDKIDYSFEELRETNYRGEYWNLVAKITTIINENEYYDKTNEKDLKNDHLIELEKGFIFEKCALLSNLLTDKINYLTIAKQFFSNTKNSRSYLLNIYIDYFNCLLMLNDIIKNYSFSEYSKLKSKLEIIKKEIKPKTVENFQESENLIYFINILSLFNERSIEAFENLFSYIRKYSLNDSNILLKTIAKIVLSNNLLLSDSQEDTEFSCNNLKRVNNYITNGVFSLVESENDRLERELNEERRYWIDRINEDESNELEFKSTFKTPVSTEIKDNQIKALENQKSKSSDPEAIDKKIDEIRGLNIEKKIIHSSLKTIAAFANTNGGHLLIGVTDDKKIFGLDQDYNSFKEKERNRDGFCKFFDQKLKEYFGESFSSTLLEQKILKFKEGDVLIIKVKPSKEEVFLLKDENGKSIESIYVRNLASTVKLEGKELAKFIRERYRNQLNNIDLKL